jgi:diadenosine tetraphosphate (Ap4A) HIT family hydrolase
MLGCVFCDSDRIVSSHAEGQLLSIRPLEQCAREHWLLVPREHIETINGLTRLPKSQALEMLHSMEKAVQERFGPSHGALLCFHVPPFSSVSHVHLHVLLPPLTCWGRFKFAVGTPWCISLAQLRRRISST